MNINVAIIDDQDIIRLGIQQLLAEAPHITFLGGYSTVKAFQRSLAWQQADIVLLDNRLPDTDLFQALVNIHSHSPETAVLILGYQLNMVEIQYAIQAGASGVICKDERVQDVLIMGIERVHAGQVYISPGAALIVGQITTPPVLSLRLDQVLHYTARGLHVQEISQKIGISRRAVYAARERLRDLLNVETNEQIVAEARRRGLIRDEL